MSFFSAKTLWTTAVLNVILHQYIYSPYKRTALAAHGFSNILMCLSKMFLNGCYLNLPSSTALV